MEFEKLKKIIVEVLNVDENEITMDTTFIDDLGADSLDVFQIIMGLEEEFDIEIPNEQAEKIVTVADAVEVLMFRADMMANPDNPTYVFNPDPDLHKLGYFLGNVDCIKEGDELNVADAVNILMYRAEILANGSATWEQIVGYDLLDPSDESTFRKIEDL